MTTAAFLVAAKRRDRMRVFDSIRLLPEQCIQASAEVARIAVPWLYRSANHIIVAGMGGSGLGGHVLQSSLADRLRVPLTIVNDYALPTWVNRHTLIIASSYSGDTEETVAAYRQARARGAKIAVITTGGALAAAAKRDRVPMYRFAPKHNPSEQPRLGLGYSIFGILGLLRKTRLARMANADIDRAIAELKVATERIECGSTTIELARDIENRVPLLIAAEHLAGALHVVQNQFHESTKQFAASFLLPELNHHLLEGLRFPVGNPRTLRALLISSDLYNERTQRRFTVTREIIRKQRIPSTTVALRASTPLGQSLELIAHGAYLSFALAMLHHIDPGPVPWVSYLKKRCKR